MSGLDEFIAHATENHAGIVKKNWWTCTFYHCHEAFPSSSLLQNHLRTCRIPGPGNPAPTLNVSEIICRFSRTRCNYRASSKEDLKRHVMSEHVNKPKEEAPQKANRRGRSIAVTSEDQNFRPRKPIVIPLTNQTSSVTRLTRSSTRCLEIPEVELSDEEECVILWNCKFEGCDRSFKSSAELKEHEDTGHSAPQIATKEDSPTPFSKCQLCPFTANTNQEMFSHLTSFHKITATLTSQTIHIPRNEISDILKTKQTLKPKTPSPTKAKKTDLAQTSSSTTTSPSQDLQISNVFHLPSATSKRCFPCVKCSKTFESKDEVQEHWRTTHNFNPTAFITSDPSKTAPKRSSTRLAKGKESVARNLADFQVVEKPARKVPAPRLVRPLTKSFVYECDFCSKFETRNMEKLAVHAKLKHRDALEISEWQECGTCMMFYPDLRSLIRHLDTCEPPVNCCILKCPEKGSLTFMQIHAKEAHANARSLKPEEFETFDDFTESTVEGDDEDPLRIASAATEVHDYEEEGIDIDESIEQQNDKNVFGSSDTEEAEEESNAFSDKLDLEDCPFCGVTLTLVGLFIHVKLEHQAEAWKRGWGTCKVCLLLFPDKRFLEGHRQWTEFCQRAEQCRRCPEAGCPIFLSTHQASKNHGYVCEECKECCSSEIALKSHKIGAHARADKGKGINATIGDHDYTDVADSDNQRRSSRISKRKRRVFESSTFGCLFCLEGFDSWVQAVVHMAAKHNKEIRFDWQPSCRGCPGLFPDQNSFIEHHCGHVLKANAEFNPSWTTPPKKKRGPYKKRKTAPESLKEALTETNTDLGCKDLLSGQENNHISDTTDFVDCTNTNVIDVDVKEEVLDNYFTEQEVKIRENKVYMNCYEKFCKDNETGVKTEPLTSDDEDMIEIKLEI